MTRSETASSSDSELAFRPMRDGERDLELFAACFAKNAAPRNRELLDWQYARNPTGEIFVDLALASSERVAAIYATLPVRMRIRGDVVLGMQSVDTITDSDFRGRGLFLKLAKTTYQRAAEAGAHVVYGFPNGSSAHGFFERLGWARLDPVPFLIRPLRSGYLLRQLRAKKLASVLPDLTLFRGTASAPPRGRIEQIARFDDRATRLWHVFAHNIDIAVERDAQYLNWRIAEKPGEQYTTHAVVDGDEFRALVCHVVKNKHGGRVGYIMESLCAPGWEPELRSLLSRALGAMVTEGADAALAWCLPHTLTYRSFLRRGFVPFPTRLRPIELHFGARAFRESAKFAEVRRNWYLSYLDADTT